MTEIIPINLEKRFKDLKRLYSEPTHPLVPILEKAVTADDCFVIITKKGNFEKPVNFQEFNKRRILLLLNQLCSFGAYIHRGRIGHGYIHESNIFYCPKRDAFTLRGFDTDSYPTEKQDRQAIQDTIKRIATENGINIDKVLSHLVSNQTLAASEELLRMASATDTLLQRVINNAHTTRRSELADFGVIYVGQTLHIETVVTAMTRALCVHDASGLISLFGFTSNKGVGWGPTTEIVNFFLDAMHSEGLLEETADFEEKRAKYSAMTSGTGLDILVVIGYAIMYSLYFNLPRNIPAFPRKQITLLLAFSSELVALRCAANTNQFTRCTMANMHAGAYPFTKILREEGWTSDNLCEYNNNNSTSCLKTQFRFENFTDQEKRTFYAWLEETPLLTQFIYAMTGAKQNSDPNQRYTLKHVDSPENYYSRFSTCSSTLHLYNARKHFQTPQNIELFMQAELQSIFSVYTSL